MPYRIAVVDDSSTDAEYVQRLLTRWAQERGSAVRAERFISAESFLFHYDEDRVWDILLLDIEMGEMNGVSLARRIRQENEQVQIVFITGLPDFIAEGYEVSALHYLMKPVAEDKLFAVLDRAAANLARRERMLTVCFDRQTDLVPLSHITYIESQRQYVVIHTPGREYRMKASLADTEAQLDEYFLQCQRSFIVNLRCVQRINAASVLLRDGTEVPISRGMAQRIGKEIIRLF